jgi:hypothetical protein
MTDTLTLFDAAPINVSTAVVEFFDPPMCCPTGLCGPTLDQTLLDVNEMILAIQAEGLTVARYQMTGQPQAFLSNPDVMRLVREQQMAALPITAVRGQVVKVGTYPTLDEVKTYLMEQHRTANAQRVQVSPSFGGNGASA